MKSLMIIAVSMFISSDYTPLAIKGDMRVDKIVDGDVVCYLAQHYNGSSHTSPAIYCLKTK